MNKSKSKAIMLRTKLTNKFLKNRSNENKINYVKQRSHCVLNVLNVFFSNIVQNLDIQQYNVDDPICENINNPLLKAIVR